jgi:hypothetical protein
MLARLRAFLQRHPLVRDALIWAVPALIIGAILRGLMLSYLPYAYWGSDSRSYYGFTEQFLDTGKISLYDKRRYLYLIGMLPVTLLPGSPLKWLAWLQHGLGLLTLVPLAYCVRKAFLGWRAWIIPATVLYAALPILLWYEHELLAECLFFHAVVWMLAGWLAFAPARGPAVQRNFWWFFGGLAALVLTKPAGLFFWPGIFLGLISVAAWRTLRLTHWIALGALFALQFTIGQDTQGAWLLYTSAFPLTRLETPKHAEYKAEIADLVREAQSDLATHARGPDSKAWVHFLKNPERQSERPHWAALGGDDALKQRVYKELAHEGIFAHPLMFVRIALGKIIASANPGEFKADRFLPSYTVEKYESQYEKDSKSKPDRIRRLFALKKGRSSSALRGSSSTGWHPVLIPRLPGGCMAMSKPFIAQRISWLAMMKTTLRWSSRHSPGGCSRAALSHSCRGTFVLWGYLCSWLSVTSLARSSWAAPIHGTSARYGRLFCSHSAFRSTFSSGWPCGEQRREPPRISPPRRVGCRAVLRLFRGEHATQSIPLLLSSRRTRKGGADHGREMESSSPATSAFTYKAMRASSVNGAGDCSNWAHDRRSPDSHRNRRAQPPRLSMAPLAGSAYLRLRLDVASSALRIIALF